MSNQTKQDYLDLIKVFEDKATIYAGKSKAIYENAIKAITILKDEMEVKFG